MNDITKTKNKKLYDLTLAVYICQILSIFLGVTAIVGIVINYIKREEVKGTWLESHFNWQIRTFWFALLWFVIGMVLMMIFIGMFVLIADLVWFIYRAVKGLLLFLDEKPISYAPHDSANDPKNNIKKKKRIKMQQYNKSKTAKYFTRGGQITFHNWRMLFQINKTVGKIYLFCLAVLTFLIAYLITPREIILAAFYWIYSQISRIAIFLHYNPQGFDIPYHGHIYHETPESFLTQWQFIENAKLVVHFLIISLIVGFIVSLIVIFFIIRWLTKKGKEQTEDQFIRGTKLVKKEQLIKQIIEDGSNSDIVIDNVPLVINSETQHILAHGTTGAGKSQLIMKFLDCLRKRGDKVFIYDKGCTYTSVYCRQGIDKILNPFDTRCEDWDLWSEALDAPDFENMAESLIPMHGETDPFWVNAARTIFGSAAYTMQDDKDRSIDKLLKLLLTSELKDLERYLAGTEAATLASGKIEKTAISIRSVITTYLKPLRFLYGLQGEKFSIRNWINNEKDNGWLFVSSNAEHHAALKPLISMWIAMASITLLSLPPNQKRRIWFICDELPSLHKLPQLPETISEVRKFGGCFLLGMQSYAQLEKVYGRHGAREIFDLLNTRFFFRSPSADMAKLVSYELGEQEIEDMRENYSYGANTIRDGISIGAQHMSKPAVIYSDIMGLEDLSCYLRLPANYPIALLDLKLQKRPELQDGFSKRIIKKDIDIEDNIRKVESKFAKFTIKKATANNTDVATNEKNEKAVFLD